MERRTLLSGIVTASVIGIAGCSSATKSGVFRLDDIGLVERDDSVAAYVQVTNTGDKASDFVGYLAPYDSEGVRLDDWQPVATGRDSPIRPNRTVEFYSTYEDGDSHWFDSNQVGQVVNAYTARFRAAEGSEPAGDDYTTDDIGDILEKP